MSVAIELPPVVFIPQQARRAGAVGLAERPRLTLVPDCGADVEVHRSEQFAADIERLRRAHAAPLRLTTRGLAVLLLATVILGLLMLWVAYRSFPAAPAGPRPTSAGVVTVQSGDTLWSIAQRVSPGRDPRAVVDELRADNDLSEVSLTPGQTLKVG
jgi:nucleoid-associated protein YgaU